MNRCKTLLLNFLRRMLIVAVIFCFYMLTFHAEKDIRKILTISACVLAAACILAECIIRFKKEKAFYILISLLYLCVGLMLTVLPRMTDRYINATSQVHSEIQSPFFQDKRVLVLVPHQDDDLNLAGGIIEQYVASGSEVSIVFATNGDYLGAQESRFAEALSVAEYLGVDTAHVYFLGFGDSWTPIAYEGKQIQHIYNSPDSSLVWKSHYGAEATYGTAHKDCYQQLPYTRASFVSSVADIIQDIRPDVIYAVDYDTHPDHRALSLFFEEALHQVLKSDSSYHPSVFKGFCYDTAWGAVDDFTSSLNVLSTQNIGSRYMNHVTPYYIWENRVRIPVYAGGLNKYLSRTDSYIALRCYGTQGGSLHSGQITNSDKVFWQRRTDSVLYNAQIQVGTKAATALNDFTLLDASDIFTDTMDLGVVPVSESVHIALSQPELLTQLALYDDPSEQNNILGGYVLFPDGTQIPFESLNPSGEASYIDFPETITDSFTIQVTSFEGSTPGLTEVEAYGPSSQPEGYLMLADSNGNFVYDYLLDRNQDTAMFSLYSYPGGVSFEDTSISLSADTGYSYTLVDGNLVLDYANVSSGSSCTLTVRYGDMTTTVYFNKPFFFQETCMRICQKLDHEICTNPLTCLTVDGQITYLKRVQRKTMELLNS